MNIKRILKNSKKSIDKAVAEITEKYEKNNQIIFDLEARLNINSDNSSLPSSKTPIYQSKIVSSGEKSGQKNGHKQSKLNAFDEEEITEFIEHTKDSCPNCNENNLELIRTRDELDIKYTILKRRHNFYDYKYKDCGKIVTSEILLELHGENQYGVETKTLISVLSNYGFIAYNRIRKILCGLSNEIINPSEGYMNKLKKSFRQTI